MKQLVEDCTNDNPEVRPSASLVTEMIGNMIKGECYIRAKQKHQKCEANQKQHCKQAAEAKR